MRITKNVFTNLAISMIGFGIVIGVLFPFFSLAMGISKNIAFSLLYFSFCILAGIMVGAVNIVLVRVIVKKRLKRLSNSMSSVENHLFEAMTQGKEHLCSSDTCCLPVDSNDEFGESANAFNKLLKAFEASLRMQNAFRSYNEMLTSQIQLESLTSNSLSKMSAYTKSCAGAIYVVKSGELSLAASEGIISADTLTKNELMLNVLKTKKSKVIDFPEDIVIDGLLASIKPNCIIIEPIIYKDTLLGIIVLANQEAFSVETKTHLQVFSKSLALALNNSLKHSQLQTLVALDPLTGLYNRRFGINRLGEEYSAAIRTQTPLGIMMFDIDHFKRVNDVYGHIAGDKVLVDISQMTKAILRAHDITMRYGGEEFIAILPGASTHDTLVVADRLRTLVESSFIPYGDNRINVTISIGVLSYPETEISNAEDLIKLADAALYKAKENGRNKVVLHDDSLIP